VWGAGRPLVIAVIGGVMTAAAGARTGGRSAFYQAALAGFGWHTVTHLAQAAAVRAYPPGLVTAPLIVAPFSVWAWRWRTDACRRAPGIVASGGKWRPGMRAVSFFHPSP
jgi:hypothetical protein